MKRIFVCLLCALLLCTCVSAETEQNWYFVPKKAARPQLPPDGVTVDPEKTIYLGGEEKRVYLTFDAGYVNENVFRILDVLEQEEVPAIFFVLSHTITSSPEFLNRLEEGRFMCGNHTMTHKNLARASKEEIKEELTGLEEVYRRATGRELDKFFRPPEGTYDAEVIDTAAELGYRTVFWSAAYADWDNERQMAPEKALRLLLERTHPGAVVLLHPTSATNAEILSEYIRTLKEEGYTFGSLTEL